jgi:hypothetical protein
VSDRGESITSFRVRIRTGRHLSGSRNVYQPDLTTVHSTFSAENSSREGGTDK